MCFNTAHLSFTKELLETFYSELKLSFLFCFSENILLGSNIETFMVKIWRNHIPRENSISIYINFCKYVKIRTSNLSSTAKAFDRTNYVPLSTTFLESAFDIKYGLIPLIYVYKRIHINWLCSFKYSDLHIYGMVLGFFLVYSFTLYHNYL